MKKFDAVRYLNSTGNSFIANVVLCQHSDSARKLKALAKLVQEGHTVSLGQFAIDVLVVDGAQAPWSSLVGGRYQWRDNINNIKYNWQCDDES